MPTVASIRQMDVFLPLPLGADAVNAARRRELQPHGAAEAGRDDGAGAERTSPRSPRGSATRTSATARSPSTSCRCSSQVVGNVRRARAGAARIGGAGAADRVRQRREPAADARDRPAEGDRGPHRARRELAAAGAAAADRERAARPARRRRRPARSRRVALQVVRDDQSRQHSAARRDRARRHGARVHVRRVDPDRHRVRPGAGAARRARRSQHVAEGRRPKHAGRRRLRQLAAPAAQPAGRGGGGDLADAARRRRAAGSQLRAAAERVAGLRARRRHLDAARRERASVRRIATPRSRSTGRSATRSRAVPGVTMRGAVSSLPFTSSVGWGSINVEGWTPQPGQELQVDQRGATPDYFRTMGIPLVQGRFFTDCDMPPNAEPVVDHRREVRAALLAGRRRRSASTSGAIPSTQADDRRRRRHGEAVRPRRRRPHRRLSARRLGAAIRSRGRSSDPAAVAARHGAARSTSSIRRSPSTTSRRCPTG